MKIHSWAPSMFMDSEPKIPDCWERGGKSKPPWRDWHTQEKLRAWAFWRPSQDLNPSHPTFAHFAKVNFLKPPCPHLWKMDKGNSISQCYCEQYKESHCHRALFRVNVSASSRCLYGTRLIWGSSFKFQRQHFGWLYVLACCRAKCCNRIALF